MRGAVRWVGVAAVAVIALAAGAARAATYNIWQDTGTVISANEGSTNVPATAVTTGANDHRTLMQTTAQAATAANFRSLNTDAGGTWTEFARIYLNTNYATAQTITAPSANIYVRGTATTDQIYFTLVDFDPAGVAGNGVVLFTSPTVTLSTTTTLTAFTGWTGTGGTVAAGHRLVLEAWVRPNVVGDQARIYINNSTTTQSTVTVTETPAASGTITIGNAATGEAATTLAPGAAEVALDAFTLTSTATVTPTSITVTTPAGSAALIGSLTLENTSACTQATPYSTITNPATDVVSFTTFTGLSIGTVASNLWVCVTPKTHANMAVPPGTQVAVTGQITAVAATGYTQAGSDTVSAARTIDNLSPGNATWGTVTPGNAQVTLNWTNPGDADFNQVVILRNTASIADVPVEGTTYAQGNTIGTSTVRYVGPLATFLDNSGLTNGTAYYYKIFAKDSNGNYAAGVQTGPHTPSAGGGTITIGQATTGEAATTLAPGAAEVALDAFTLTSTATVTPTSITVTMPAGSAALIGSLTLENTSACNQATPYSTITNPVTDVVSFTTFTGLSIGTVASNLWVCVTPKTHANMAVPPGTQVAVTGQITAVAATGYTQAGSDTVSPARTIDNLSPGNATWGTVTPGNAQVTLNWTNPGDADFNQVVILRKATTAISDVPVEGTTYTAGTALGASTVRYVGALATFLDNSGLTNGTAYYYKIFAKDSNGNYAAGVQTGPHTPSAAPFIADGDATAGSVKPVVAIVNPMDGAMVQPSFRVQARIFSPKDAGGGAQPITGVTLLVDGVASSFTMSPLTEYGTTTESGVWGATVDATLAAGSHTLRVTATSIAGTVYSGTITVTVVVAGTGDGTLLVRDNASQLCDDCHAMQTHSSQATGTKWGSWSVTCRECHTPHVTTNIELVRTSVTPPALTGPTTARTVVFWNKTGYAANSYANSTSLNGPCQVCHTRTDYYRSTGAGPGGAHETGDCSSCHVHTKGLAATCTNCHGDEFRTSFTGADPRQTAAPPAVAAGSVSVTGGGAHIAHVNKATYRANPLPCASCHPAPHATKGSTDIAWGTVATGNGAIAPATMNPPAGTLTTTWTTTPNCTNWCHGDGLAGGGRGLAWSWTGVGPLACNSCHGTATNALPAVATAHHPQNLTCQNCHLTDYNTGDQTKHVDGTVDHPTGCRACHGQLVNLGGAVAANTDPLAAPGASATAVDSRGNSARTVVGVGAHIKHVNAGMMAGQGCLVCHSTTPPALDVLHANGTVAIGWNSPANALAVVPNWTSPNCTNYCHSDARPLPNPTAVTRSVVWTSTTALGCGDCHGVSGVTSTLSHAHQVHTGTYGLTCIRCHTASAASDTAIVAGGGAHVNGARNVDFDTSGMNNSGGSYNYTNYQCSSTYCHSDGTDVAAPYVSGPSLAWTGTSTCSSCHASGTTMATGSHLAHVNAIGTYGKNYLCENCHFTTTNNGTAIASTTTHVNGAPTVDGNPSGVGGASLSYNLAGSPRSCSTYCHSSGQATPAMYNDMTWAVTVFASPCSACHGRAASPDPNFTSNFGAPNYVTGAQGSATANSHSAHVGSAASCAICHQQTTVTGATTLALHLDGQRQVTWDAKRTTGGATYNGTSKQCASVTCHGAGQPIWGGPSMTCLSCHGTTGAEVSELGVDFWKNDVVATINTTEWAYSGHGKASGSYDVTLNPAAAFPTTPTAGLSECLYCHDKAVGHNADTNPFRLRGVTDANGYQTNNYSTATEDLANAVCLNCHSATGNGVDPDGTTATYTKKVATLKSPKSHHGAKHSGATSLGGEFCWDCHDPHGERISTGGNIAMIATNVLAVNDGTYGYLGATGVQRAVNFTSEAATPPAIGKAAETTTAANAQHVGLCQACHAATNDALLATNAWTKYWNRLGYDDPDGPNPPGTTAPAASTHNSTSAATPYCISCHTHATGFGGECIGCHATTQGITKGPAAGGTRRIVVDEFKQTWSHKASTNATPASRTVSNYDCAVCHMEGDPATGNPAGSHGDGYINLRDPDTGLNIKGVTFSAGFTDAGSYSSTVTDAAPARFLRNLSTSTIEPDAAAIQINQCLKCHDANGAAAYGAGLALNPLTTVIGGSAGKPFGTTIAGAGYNGGNGYTACPTAGVNGCVTDINRSFATTNASYHPIRGRQNNSYIGNQRLAGPWSSMGTAGQPANKTGNSITQWGVLITCWDCHSANAASGPQNATPTAHGGSVTIRQAVWTSSQTATNNLCRVCHNMGTSSGSHGTGSALQTGNSNYNTYSAGQCYYCHLSERTKPARPIPGEDLHGFNAFAPGHQSRVPGDTMWPVGTGDSYKPYAFMRNVGTTGTWRSTSWKPRTGPGVPAGTATCGGSMSTTSCSNTHTTYAPGGVY